MSRKKLSSTERQNPKMPHTLRKLPAFSPTAADRFCYATSPMIQTLIRNFARSSILIEVVKLRLDLPATIPAATKASMPMKALARMAASVREYTTRMSPSVHRFSAALIRSAGSLNLSANAGRQWRTESPANRDGFQRRRSSIVGCRSAD